MTTTELFMFLFLQIGEMAKVLIPSDLLKKLECSLCKLHLSVFPIFIRKDGNKPICGRCKVPNDVYIRDEAYEAIAQFLIFPCAEEKNGCLEQMSPLSLKDHEQTCLWRKWDCPSKNFTFCKWHGPNKELRAHFVAMHDELMLTDQEFKINFSSSANGIMLIPFHDKLFLVKKEMDSRTGTFTCSCTQIIMKKSLENFNYFVQIKGTSCSHNCSIRSTTPTKEDQTTISTDEIKDLLNDSPVVIAVIQIVTTTLNDKEDKSSENRFDWQLLRKLKCPVCLEYFCKPIYQCKNGHGICNQCKSKIQYCPVCKAGIQSSRNLTLEEIAKWMNYPCKYNRTGCSVALKFPEIKHHEKFCDYGSIECPVSAKEKCMQKITKANIMRHVLKNHRKHVLNTNKINIPINTMYKVPNIKETFLFQFSNRLFKVSISIRVSKQT